MFKQFLCAAALATVSVSVIAASAHDASGSKAKVTLVYDHVLPNVPGKSIRGVLVEYAPRGFSPAHHHPKSAFIYATVLEGAIQSQVNDGPMTTYYREAKLFRVSRRSPPCEREASATEPARLLAVFVVDTEDTILTTPYEK